MTQPSLAEEPFVCFLFSSIEAIVAIPQRKLSLTNRDRCGRREYHGCSAEAQDENEQQPKLSQRDQLRIAAQQICPVSGEKPGRRGTPVKVTVGKQKAEVFLCCKGCLKGQLDARHWKTIHANFAETQAECPLMGHKLPANPKWTIA